jgi:dipeptidyl aminopeptidase/acylaminoacyl peptidase
MFISSGRVISISLAAAAVLFSAACDLEPDPTTRTVTIETREVTSPDVAVSPDGQILVFSLLGHLFRLPVQGGLAEQLTFGPFYDEDPAFSPDGKEIAFASDRGGGEGNLFVLTLDTGALRQVTDEFWAARPTWSPDSESLLYLSYELGSIRCRGPASVHRVSLDGNVPQALTDSIRPVRSVGFTPEGRMTWVRQEPTEAGTRSIIELVRDDGAADIVATVDGQVDRLGLGPDGVLWVHRIRPWAPRAELVRIHGGEAPAPVADITRRPPRPAQETRSRSSPVWSSRCLQHSTSRQSTRQRR